MKFWLIIFLMNPQGEFVAKKEIVYPDEATCYMMMEPVARKYTKSTVQMVCVSDDHHSGRKQDPGVDYD
jgi:hypothetical protein